MRYFLEIAYDGTAYHGWQVQPNAISVQQVIEEILHKLLGAPTLVVGAGRTDAGVHARKMFLHFDTERELNNEDFVRRLNSILPQDISVYAVHVSVYDDHYEIDQIIDGETVAEVLDYVQYNPKKMVRSLETWVTSSMKAGIITPEEGREFLSNYRSGLYGYTYLERD